MSIDHLIRNDELYDLINIPIDDQMRFPILTRVKKNIWWEIVSHKIFNLSKYRQWIYSENIQEFVF